MTDAELLAMPENLLMRYVDEMPRIQAQQVLQIAHATTYPQLLRHAPNAARDWMQRWVMRATSRLDSRSPLALTINGVAVAAQSLGSKLRNILGGGVER